MNLHIDKIRTDGGTQSRAAINDETVADYAEAMADPDAAFPPVIVYNDGQEYWLADGFHRLEAWRRIGRTEIPTEIRQGDRRRAVLHSCGANAAHGLRRSVADRRRAVMTLLEDAEWSAWSDRQIARQCAVDHKTVGKYRAELTGEIPSEPRTYTTKHGTEAQMDTSRIGKARDEYPEPACWPKTAHKPSDTFEADNAGISVAPGAAGGPAPSQEPEPYQSQIGAEPELAPDPYGYAKLTEVALLDLANGLRAALDDEKTKRKAAEARAKKLKERLDQHTSDDKDAVIVALNKKVEHAENAKWKATEDRDAYHARLHIMTKERDAAIKSLEAQEITL